MLQQLRKVTAEKVTNLVLTIKATEQATEALYKQMGKLDSKVATYTFDLTEIQDKLAYQQKLLTEAKAALLALETAEYDASYVRVISQGKKSAQIVVYTKDENGKKVSQTRHLRKEGDSYTGHSLFGLRVIKWNLNKTEPLPVVEVAEAA